MHKLLQRQLKRCAVDADWVQQNRVLLEQISQSYQSFDRDREIIERSLELVSLELNERNRELQHKIEQLQDTYFELGHAHATLNAVLDATGEAVVAFDEEGILLHINQMAVDILRCDPAAFINRKKLFACLRKFLSKLKTPAELSYRLRQLMRQPEQEIFGLLEFKNGQIFEYHSAAQKDKNGLLTGRVWCFRNVTDDKANQALIQHQAYHDALTNLPNRLLLLDRLNQGIALARRNDSMCAVLFLDLDHFKKVNDTIGHQQGDLLLFEVAQRIGSCVREHDTLARLGGDEFVIVLENIRSHRMATRTAARVIEVMEQPFELQGNSYYLSTSIGISIFPRDDIQPEELIRKADLAMYHAKEQGRNNFQFFDPALERLAHYQLEIETHLRRAIEAREFELFFQRQAKPSGQLLPRFEALLRWHSSKYSQISPADFIPVAEQTGLMIPLGDFVLEAAIQAAATWYSSVGDELVVAINISAIQFAQKGFVEQIKVLLKHHQLPGHCIELEITESLLLEDLALVSDKLARLKALGVSIAIDDFGTGYSSLKYLQRLPIDVLKIDRSFVQQLAMDKKQNSIVHAIISLAASLDLKVVAEGVEDETTAAYLSQQGCDYLQGFLYSKPEPLSFYLECNAS